MKMFAIIPGVTPPDGKPIRDKHALSQFAVPASWSDGLLLLWHSSMRRVPISVINKFFPDQLMRAALRLRKSANSERNISHSARNSPIDAI
jgi:hypothetical protein